MSVEGRRLRSELQQRYGSEIVAYALARVRRVTSEFFSWWVGELKALLPSRLDRLLSPPANELELELADARLTMCHRSGSTTRDLGAVDIEPADPESARSAIRSIVGEMALDHVQILLRLPAERALRKIVDLPAAAEENLRQVAAFEMDRLTPFAADSVHYAVRVIDRDAEQRRIRAELIVVPRAGVDPSVELLREVGLDPDAIILPRNGDTGAPAHRLPLAGNGGGGRRLIGRASLVLLVLAGVLVAATVVLALDRKERYVEALKREVATARKEAEEGRRLQEQIEQLSSAGDFIVDKKRSRPPAVEVLNDLTRTLPDDIWLYRLRMINDEIQTFGYSPNASAIIGLLENSALFQNAQFRAPLTRDPRVDAEQFHIAFQIARKTQP
jgi:general secretion pathway protein L